eukprot:m.253230 g.253230  ORF g.253230 m.253230 type:complete len:1714 (-) comp17533_c0_seq1:91-5232(-)
MVKAQRQLQPAALQRLFTLTLLVLLFLPLVALESPVPLHDYPGWVLTAATHADANLMPGEDAPGLPTIKPKQGQHRPTFVPPFIRFQDQPLCQPMEQLVTIVNTDPRKPLRLISISSSSSEFQASWFKQPIVAPGENTTFSVAFLGHALGAVEANMTLLTSQGEVVYELFANSLDNPLRLRPLIFGRIPIKLRLAQTVHVYNPYPEPLLVTEVFTSNKDIHVEVAALFKSHLEGAAPIDRWVLPPYASRPIFIATVTSQETRLVQGYIHIRTNRSDSHAVLPILVDVVDQDGLYFGPGDVIDFGTVSRTDPPVHRAIQLLFRSPAETSAQILDIKVLSCTHTEDSNRSCPAMALHHRHEHFTLAPYTWTRVSTLTMGSGRLADAEGLYMGVVQITYTGGSAAVVRNLKVPFFVRFTRGALEIPVMDTVFRVTEAPFTRQVKTLTLFNSFDYPVALTNITMATDVVALFKVSTTSLPVVIDPHTRFDINVSFRANSSDLVMTRYISLHTNQSYHAVQVPLFTFNGRLRYAVTDKGFDDIDFGTFPVDEEQVVDLHILNTNPVKTQLIAYATNMPEITLEYTSQAPSPDLLDVVEYGKLISGNWSLPEPVVLPGNDNVNPDQVKPLNVTLMPGVVASFQVRLRNAQERRLKGELRLYSTYGVLYVPLAYEGVRKLLNLRPKRVSFRASFPPQSFMHSDVAELPMVERVLAPVQRQDLYLRPDNRSINIERIALNDPRITFEPNEELVDAETNVTDEIKLGTVIFNFSSTVDADNYMPRVRRAFSWRSKPIRLTAGDLDELTVRNRNWRSMRGKRDMLSATMGIEANGQEAHEIPITARLKRPQLLRNRSLTFELTQTKQTRLLRVNATNHGALPLLVEVVPIDELLEGELASKLEDYLSLSQMDLKAFAKHRRAFRAADFTLDSELMALRNVTHLGYPAVRVLSPTRLVLAPESTTPLPLAFTPEHRGACVSYLLLMNNLTILEPVKVDGTAGKGTFGFPKTQTNVVNGSLTLPLQAEDLDACRQPSGLSVADANHSYVFNFTVVNRGNMPVSVVSLGINGVPCQGDGFRIHNCAPFVLEPKKQHLLSVGFTPDFTTATVRRKLVVQLAGSERPLYFPLVATVPPDMLGVCFSAIPGPPWARYLKPGVLLVALSLAVAVSVFECGGSVSALVAKVVAAAPSSSSANSSTRTHKGKSSKPEPNNTRNSRKPTTPHATESTKPSLSNAPSLNSMIQPDTSSTGSPKSRRKKKGPKPAVPAVISSASPKAPQPKGPTTPLVDDLLSQDTATLKLDTPVSGPDFVGEHESSSTRSSPPLEIHPHDDEENHHADASEGSPEESHEESHSSESEANTSTSEAQSHPQTRTQPRSSQPRSQPRQPRTTRGQSLATLKLPGAMPEVADKDDIIAQALAAASTNLESLPVVESPPVPARNKRRQRGAKKDKPRSAPAPAPVQEPPSTVLNTAPVAWSSPVTNASSPSPVFHASAKPFSPDPMPVPPAHVRPLPSNPYTVAPQTTTANGFDTDVLSGFAPLPAAAAAPLPDLNDFFPTFAEPQSWQAADPASADYSPLAAPLDPIAPQQPLGAPLSTSDDPWPAPVDTSVNTGWNYDANRSASHDASWTLPPPPSQELGALWDDPQPGRDAFSDFYSSLTRSDNGETTAVGGRQAQGLGLYGSSGEIWGTGLNASNDTAAAELDWAHEEQSTVDASKQGPGNWPF